MANQETYRQCKYCRCRSLVEMGEPKKPMCESHLAAYMDGMNDGLESACRTLDKIANNTAIISSRHANANA